MKKLLIILFTAGILLSYQFNKPFWGHHDWNGVYWGIVARNFSRDQFTFNFHYPPLFPLIWSWFFGIFGIHNWVSRLMAASFSLGSIAIFYFLVKKFFSVKTAFLASILWIFTPMFIYFGKMPVHEIPLMFFVLLSFWFYLTKKFWPLFLSILAAELITWPGFFIVPAITIHAFVTKSWSKKHLYLWASSVGVFGLHLLHDYFVTGDYFGGGLREIFLMRVTNVSLIPYLMTLGRWAWTYYFLLVPLSIVGLLINRNKILILFLTYALFYPIIFRDAAFRHDYLLIYFWPFLTLSSALVLKRYLLVLIVIILMFFFRWKFILALENSDIYKESVRFGQFINANSLTADSVTAKTLDPNVPWDGWFISYYADRILTDHTASKTFYYNPGGEMSFTK